MSEKNTWDNIDRRAFMKKSTSTVAGIAGLAKLGMAGKESRQDTVEPLSIHVPDAVLDDLQGRLARTRFPDQLEGAGWAYGTELSYLKELVAYWRSEFDWRVQERILNRFDHFHTKIDSLKIHFINQRSKEKNAFPLIMIHGWPGSFFEFYKVIEPLTDPVTHGGKPEDAFHVVCPSLPGYGFSEIPRKAGYGCKQMADIFVKLMARLGYRQYGAHGGDWGSYIATWMAALNATAMKGLHLNATVANPLEATAKQMLLMNLEGDYVAIQSTKPQSLGYALNDSPAGLAAWIIEKFRGWSDCGGNVESSFTKDELLTNIMIYWITQTATSSMRLYYETRKMGWKFIPDERIAVPAGFTLSRLEPQIPRKQIEESFHVTHWSVMPSGGHFAELEEPDLLVKDMRMFFRNLR